MKNYPTPHIDAKPEDFAKTVLMPGDPLRAKFVAETFFDSPKLINNVRGIQGYTGLYKSVPVSVMASGMGMPSIGIYSYELYNFFEVENIIRVGSAGGIVPTVRVRDIIIGQGACTDSNYASQFCLPGTFAPIADYTLLSKCVDTAKALGIRNYHVGNVLRGFCGAAYAHATQKRLGKNGRACRRNGKRSSLHECGKSRQKSARHIYSVRSSHNRRKNNRPRTPNFIRRND